MSQTPASVAQSAAALAQRQHQITGHPQRIEEISPEALSGEARAMIDAIRNSAGAGALAGEGAQIPGYFLTMVKHPELFACQLSMGTALFKGRIPPRERELAILRTAWLTRAPYEWGQHMVIARRNALTDAEITRVTLGSAAPGWSAHEAAILAGVEELLADQMIGDAVWDVLAQAWDEAQLIEFPMMVGQYVATAFVQNSLRMRLAPGNAGLVLP